MDIVFDVPFPVDPNDGALYLGLVVTDVRVHRDKIDVKVLTDPRHSPCGGFGPQIGGGGLPRPVLPVLGDPFLSQPS